MDNEAETHIQKGQNFTSIVVVLSDEDDTVINQDEEVDLAANSEQNMVPSSEVDNICSVDITGSLIGLTRKTIDDMYQLYSNHARAIGFSVRKSTSRYSSYPDVVVEKYFVCSCSGSKKIETLNPDSIGGSVVKRGQRSCLTRTECKASLRVKLNGVGLYEVVSHVNIHNHALTRKEWSHHHRSERRISNAKGKAIEDMLSSGMRATDSYRYMVHEVGGEENVGHTLTDHLNFVNRWKMNAIEGGDAQKVIEMLQQEDAEQKDFFFRVKLDDDGRLCNLFWRDSMMKEDYDIFGDIMVFDTTYRTNKYNLICAPFVGVNHHWKNVMFGCAFLADEKVESFQWLFEVFKKSMAGKCPVSLFTDQDQAISNAIEKVFPETRHRLCLWHLYQNAVSRFAKLKSENSFKDAFKKCLSGCVDETEFESCWRSMISEYKLENHPWFNRLYGLKEKWCTGLSKDFFSAGILSSQRSESTNHAIGFSAKKNTSLTEFYGIFKETLKHWRSKEQKDEFQCSRSMPESALPLTGILKHASEVYTLTIFRYFEAEFFKSISSSSIIVLLEDRMMVYDVSSYDNAGLSHRVIFDCFSNLITCSCKKFEECGFLCYHCLRVLHINSIFTIPEYYIKKRWTKFSKSEIWDKFSSTTGRLEKVDDCFLWRHEMTRKFYNLVLQCQENEEARMIVEEGYNRDSQAVNTLITTLTSTEQSDTSIYLNSSHIVQDPTRSVTKGRSQRIKGHFQKNKKKKTVASNSITAKEFGSKTPNIRLL
ncbi:protein FAR1-RELATED SEQUENCE 5-like [Henckelia pumila]|uniref:protein FAR1-RELATED SEQUENCE 5-like n=1 Tax=Henckelia pumila TaxID=405737 RepID=UPI003C6E9A71